MKMKLYTCVSIIIFILLSTNITFIADFKEELTFSDFYDGHKETFKKHEDLLKELRSKILITDRLSLSFTEEEDIDFLAPHILDESVMYGYDNSNIWPKTIEEAKEYLLNNLNYKYPKAYFTIKLKNKQSDYKKQQCIGQIGFSFLKQGRLWVCYWLSPQYQNQGYMSEASLPLIKMFFELCDDFKVLVIQSLVENIPSRKIAKKICNFVNKDNIYVYKEENKKEQVTSRDKNDVVIEEVVYFSLSKK